jgi:tRNA-2-methylthio-N6-dimethylallyladenosine synthase
LAEIKALVAEGVIEITLLGQNVNTYGVEFGDKGAFAKLLRACGEIEGLERVRFTSPHPAAFTEDVILAMAETHNVMPQLHMPLQSGSDRILKDMKRSYRSSKYLGILDKVRELIPDAAISTDIIVGFPSETEEDFQETLRVVRESRFAITYTFQYSKRPGTPAADLPGQIPKEVVQERYERLLEVVNDLAWQENKLQVGKRVEVLIGNNEGRKDDRTNRLTGRARDSRLVHIDWPEDISEPRPGDLVWATVIDAKPYFLIADTGANPEVKRTIAGDAHDRAQAKSCAVPGVTTESKKGTIGLSVDVKVNQ